MSKIEVFEDPRHPGEYLACEGDLFWYVTTDACGDVVLVDDDVTPISPPVLDAVRAHLDPEYIAPDYHAISVVI